MYSVYLLRKPRYTFFPNKTYPSLPPSHTCIKNYVRRTSWSFSFSLSPLSYQTHFLCLGADLGSGIRYLKITIRLFIYSSFRLSTTHHRWLPLISGLVIGPPVGDITSRGNPLVFSRTGNSSAYRRRFHPSDHAHILLRFPFLVFLPHLEERNLFMPLQLASWALKI